jgi:transcriptional regulator with XRE-family HTH domain
MRIVTTDRQAQADAPALAARKVEGFHRWLQDQLKARNMSQRQLAQRSGVDHSSISRLVRGDRLPSLHTAMRLARGIDPSLRDPGGFGAGAVAGISATARVEYALRVDDRLTEADVRDIMLYYLATRRGRVRRPEIAKRLAGS